MAKRQQINTEVMVHLACEVAREQAETGVISADGYSGEPCVHVAPDSLQEVTPVDGWVWEFLGDYDSPHQASVTIDDVRFFALFTDEEKAEALSDD